MRSILKALAFPFILFLSVVKALFDKPFHLSYSKENGLEIGIVILIGLCFSIGFTIALIERFL